MLETIKQSIRFEYDGEKSRMVAELDGDSPVLNFQVDMIRKNRIPGVIPMEVRSANNQLQLFYDISGGWLLKDQLDHREFTGPEFAGFLEGIVRVLTGADAYLLDVNQFVLDEDHLLLNRRMEPELMYLPVRFQQNIHRRFKDFLVHLIVYRARLKDSDSGAFLTGILNYLKRDDFNLFEFQKALRGLYGNGVGAVASTPEAYTPAPAAPIPPHRPVSLSDLIPKEELQPMSASVPAAPAGVPEQREAKGAKPKGFGNKKTKSVPVGFQTEIRRRHKRSSVFAALAFQAVLAIAVSYAFVPVYEIAGDMTSTYAALGLMALCVDGLLLKNLFKEENKVDVPVRIRKPANEGPSDPVQLSDRSSPPVMHEFVPVQSQSIPIPAINFSKQVVSNATVMGQNAGNETEVLFSATSSPAGSADTEVLSVDAPSSPYLVRKGPVQEIIRLNRPKVVIGRQPDMADQIVNDGAIGRMHAEITVRDGQCQIRDLNSRNGTYVNGNRLNGPKIHILKIGDEIRMAHLEYILAKD